MTPAFPRTGTRALTLAFAVAVFTGAASMRCLDALLPALAADFGRSVGSTGQAVSAYALSYSVCQLFYGPLGDRVGAYRVVTAAACVSALAAAACAAATSFGGLVALRFLAGASAAAIGPLTLAWLGRAIPPSERPIAFARMSGAAILGTAAGQAGGGVIGGTVGWPVVFVVMAALFAASGIALVLIGRGHPGAIADRGHAPAHGSRAGVLALVRRPSVLRVLSAVAVQGFAIYLSLTYVGALLADRLTAGPARAGLVISLFGAGAIVFVFAAPRILAFAATATRAAAGGAIGAVGFTALALSNSEAAAAASLFAVGFGFLMLHNVLQVMASRMAPDALGASLSLFAAMSCLSQAAGAAVGGYAFDRVGPTPLCLASASILVALGVTVAMRERFGTSSTTAAAAEEVVYSPR